MCGGESTLYPWYCALTSFVRLTDLTLHFNQSLPLWSQSTALCFTFTYPCPNFKCLWFHPWFLCACLKKENVFVFFPEIYSSYIFVLNNISLFFPFMRADILGFSNFSWVWFLFPLNDSQFQSLFYLDHLPVSSAHSYTGLHHFLSIITFCYNYQCAYLDSISWGKTKHFRH